MRAVSCSSNLNSRSERAVSGERPFFSGMMIQVQISASVSGVTVVCMAISETRCHGTIKLSDMSHRGPSRFPRYQRVGGPIRLAPSAPPAPCAPLPHPAEALPAMRPVFFTFYFLPFAFCLSGCCFSPESKIQNRQSKIVRRPLGDPDWVTDTAQRLGLECTVRPRGRPKKQS